jgi:hypothetical protein
VEDFQQGETHQDGSLKLVAKTDMAVKAEHGARWRRLARFHRETLHEVERLRTPHPPSLPDPAEELLKEWPELQAFGVEWVRM